MSRVAIIGDLTGLESKHLTYFFAKHNLSPMTVHVDVRDSFNDGIVEFTQDNSLDLIVHTLSEDRDTAVHMVYNTDLILTINPDRMGDFCRQVCQVAVWNHVAIRQISTKK